jgi:integrase
MPAKKRFKTKYAGVYYIESSAGSPGKGERVYYIVYRKGGKLIEEKAGRQHQDDMTPARAAAIRTQRILGKELSNKERRMARNQKLRERQSRWTIDRLWEEYKIHRPDLRGKALDENRYKNHIQPLFGHKEVTELIQLDIDRLRIRLLKTKSPQTVKHVLAHLKRVINFGVKKGFCKSLPFTIEMPTVHNLKTEDLSSEQLSRLLDAIEKDPDLEAAKVMRMALFTGMRRGEIFGLKWTDVDFERGFITIRDPKGGPNQIIPMNDAAREILQNQPRTKSDLVFPSRYGNKRTVLNQRFANRIKARAGLPKDFRPLHGLRHVYASMLASSGQVDLYTLQKLLTHKSPQMTQRYAHLRDEALKRASNLATTLIEQAVNKKGEKDPSVARDSSE